VLATEDPCSVLESIVDRVSCSSKVSLESKKRSFLGHL
jgi:hypothetical protein